tara:strand:- start:1376 stop:1534 length:159 start_codon:yes stop_codon:yes gene_type:complete
VFVKIDELQMKFVQTHRNLPHLGAFYALPFLCQTFASIASYEFDAQLYLKPK